MGHRIILPRSGRTKQQSSRATAQTDGRKEAGHPSNEIAKTCNAAHAQIFATILLSNQRGNDLGVSYNLFVLVSRSRQTYSTCQCTIDIYGSRKFLLEKSFLSWLRSSPNPGRTRDGALTRNMNDRKSHGSPHTYRPNK